MSSSRRGQKKQKPLAMCFAGVGLAEPVKQGRTFRRVGPASLRNAPVTTRRLNREFSEATLRQWAAKAEAARVELELTGSLPSSVFDFD